MAYFQLKPPPAKKQKVEIKGGTVSLKTFTSWGYEILGYSSNEDDVVNVMWCKICVKHKDIVQKDMRGEAKAAFLRFCEGTKSISKWNARRHIESKAHLSSLGLSKNEETIVNQPDPDNNHSQLQVQDYRQPRISTSIERSAKEAYHKLFDAAYQLSIHQKPLSTFPLIVDILKRNGVRLIDGTCNQDRDREFISFLAASVREKIKSIITSATAFSLLSDGSQARKTRHEKELLMARVVYQGKAVFFTTDLIDVTMDATAENLKDAIDSSFQSLGIDENTYKNSLVGATSDGASVNTGKYNGILTRLSLDRPWLLKVHCVAHRLELAIKTAVHEDTNLQKVTNLMTTIFYAMKKGKFRRILTTTADALGVSVYTFPKVHGTRFIGHHKRGLLCLLNNWVPLALTIENANYKPTATQLGILNKLKDGRMLASAIFMLQLCVILDHVSKKIQQNALKIYEVQPLIELILDRITELSLTQP